jgi:hypothetical protein
VDLDGDTPDSGGRKDGAGLPLRRAEVSQSAVRRWARCCWKAPMVTMGPREDTTVRDELGVTLGTQRFPNKIHRQRDAARPGAVVGMPAQDPGTVGRCGWAVDNACAEAS